MRSFGRQAQRWPHRAAAVGRSVLLAVPLPPSHPLHPACSTPELPPLAVWGHARGTGLSAPSPPACWRLDRRQLLRLGSWACPVARLLPSSLRPLARRRCGQCPSTVQQARGCSCCLTLWL